MVFDFLKKKKQDDLDLPLPPEPPRLEPVQEDIPDIQFPEIPEQMPEEIPDFTIPEVAEEDIPRASDFLKEDFTPPLAIKTKIPEFAPAREDIITPRVTPTFIAVDEYSHLMENTNIVRAKLIEAEEYVERLNQLKSLEKKTFEKWRSKLEDVEKKLSYVDKVISKAQEGK